MPEAISSAQAQRAARSAQPVQVQVSDLTGGLDRRVSPTQMAPERSRRLRNAKISVAGEWQPRSGWASWMTTTMGSGRAQGAARIYLDGVAPFTLAAHSGSIYKPSDAGVRGSAVLSGRHASNPVFFPFDTILAAVFDASSVPQKTQDGTTWTQLGITAPAAAPSLSASAGGSLITAHQYEFSYSYGDEAGLATESNEGPTATITVASPNLTVAVQCAFSADPQVDQVYVYARDVTAGETVRRFAGQVANPGSGTATVTVSANTWSAEVEAPTRKNVPPAGLVHAVPWKNRWWGWVGTRLYFTEIFENQSWPTLYYIDMPFTRGDVIAAVVPLGDVLVVFGQSKQAFLIIGQTSLDFEVRPSASVEAGALGPRAVDVVEQGIVHAAAEGVYVFDGASDRLLSYDFEFDWRGMVASASEADLRRVPVVYHRRDKEVRIAVPALPVYGTPGELCLDLARTRVGDVPAWTTTDRPLGGYVSWDGVEATTGARGRLFSWSATAGTMDEEATGQSANGANVTVDYEGPEFSTGLRVARFLRLFTEFEPNDGTFGLEIKVDGRTVLTPTVTISGGVARYGTAVYGTSTYGGTSRSMVPMELPLEAEGRNLQVLAEYQGQAAFKWFTYGFELVLEPDIRGFA